MCLVSVEWNNEQSSRENGKNLFGTYRTFTETLARKPGGGEWVKQSFAPSHSLPLFFAIQQRKKKINDLMSFQRENEKWII